MGLDNAGIIVSMVAGVAGFVFGASSLGLQAARYRSEKRDRETQARIWIRSAQITTSVPSADPRPGAHTLEVIRIKVAYIGGGRPFTVFDASLLVEGEPFSIGGLMHSSQYVAAHLGGDFVIGHGTAGTGLCIDLLNHKDYTFSKNFTLRLDLGSTDFRDISFVPVLLPTGLLIYDEPSTTARLSVVRAR